MPTCTPERAETHEKWWGCQEPLTPPSLAASEQIQRAVTSNSVYFFAKVPPLVRLAMIEISAGATSDPNWTMMWHKTSSSSSSQIIYFNIEGFLRKCVRSIKFSPAIFTFNPHLNLHLRPPLALLHYPPNPFSPSPWLCAFHRFNALYWLIGSNECDVSPFSAHILTSS